MNEKLHELLSNLRLKGMAGALDEEIHRAEEEGAPVSEVIYRLLLEEQAYRRNQSLLYRLKGPAIFTFSDSIECAIGRLYLPAFLQLDW